MNGHMLNALVLALCLILVGCQSGVTWSSVPSVRCGQITTITSLTTSADTSTTTTDHTSTFDTPLTANADLKYGLSLMSYESWMTDTFSFNISMVDYSNTSVTVRFLVLDNTFFTRAKVHYIIVWWPGTYPNIYLSSPPVLPPDTYNYIDVLFGCYLTTNLLTGTGNRSQIVGGILTSNTYNNNVSNLIVSTAIAGLQLTNNVGANDFVKVESYFDGSDAMFHNVTAETNNFVKFVCVTNVIIDPAVNEEYQKTILEYKTMNLKYGGTGLETITYSQRYDGYDRLFFGFSQFNVTMSETRWLNIESSNITLVGEYYRYNVAMNEVIIEMLFFAFRTCTDQTQYYYPTNHSCLSTCPSNSIRTPIAASVGGSADYLLCKLCHHSCLTCTVGNDDNACITCPVDANRTKTGSRCPCDPGYADAGIAKCLTCSEAIPGCVSCTSATYCLDCDNITYTLNTTSHICTCSAGSYKTSSFCLTYSGCLQAILFNNTLACITCDTSLNYVKVTSNDSCVCNQGYFLNASVPECYDVCGDGITAMGHCDDGNIDYGDGCDQNCNVENGYHCTTLYNSGGSPGLSSCIIITDVIITYLYTQRIINSNKFVMKFSLSPAKQGLTANSFDSNNFVTNMPIENVQIRYDPDNAIISLEGAYLEALEGRTFSLITTFTNDLSFYADPTVMSFTATGINAQLTLDTQTSLNNILPYIVMAQGIITIVVAIFASVVGLKLAGIELFLPIQLLYFSLSTIKNQSSYSSSLANLKYTNGYSVITSYDYLRTYDQNPYLVAITYESQFLMSTNIMLGIFIFTLLWLMVHTCRIRLKQRDLDKFLEMKKPPAEVEDQKKEEINSDESERAQLDPKKEEEEALKRANTDPYSIDEQNDLREDHHYSLKIFSFQVDRVYFILYVILINQMLFAFTIMSLNMPLSTFYFPQELSIILCNFITFILMGNIVFIFYDQTSNKMINFTCINDRYVYLYLTFNVIILIITVYIFENSWAIYVITALTLSFVILVIVERPYSKPMLEFQNLVALYLTIMLFGSEVILCVMKSTSLGQSMNLVMTVLIIALILVGQILTIIRIVLKVNFKKAFDDLKDPRNDRDTDNKNKKRVKEKNLDLLGKNEVEELPSDSVRDGLYTPKDKMIDWEARNTDEYESTRGINKESQEEEELNNAEKEEQNKESKFNELELLKKRLRNTLKIKKESESKKRD